MKLVYDLTTQPQSGVMVVWSNGTLRALKLSLTCEALVKEVEQV